MNEAKARLVIKDLIDDNEHVIMEDITLHGQVRGIAHVAISEAALPGGVDSTNYPFIRVAATDAYERAIPSVASLVTKARYDMEILVSDEAMAQIGDTTPMEQMDSDFRLLCDRIVNLILTTKKFTYDSSTKFSLVLEEDVPVTKSNEDGWLGDTIFFGARIQFTIEEC